MPGFVLWCGHADCGNGYGSSGEWPKACPACNRLERWSKRRPCDPVPAIRVSVNDARFLKSIRIETPDTKPILEDDDEDEA